MKITHSELIEIGYKWILSRCAFAFKDLRTIEMETPDVIGFNSMGLFLLEAKCSRADFLADRSKLFRAFPGMGMGDFRFYIAPKGLIKIYELPKMWGLIEVSESGKAIVSHNPFGKGNIYSSWQRHDKNENAEKSMMFSALRRLHLRKRIEEIYEPIKKPPSIKRVVK